MARRMFDKPKVVKAAPRPVVTPKPVAPKVFQPHRVAIEVLATGVTSGAKFKAPTADVVFYEPVLEKHDRGETWWVGAYTKVAVSDFAVNRGGAALVAPGTTPAPAFQAFMLKYNPTLHTWGVFQQNGQRNVEGAKIQAERWYFKKAGIPWTDPYDARVKAAKKTKRTRSKRTRP